jgi:hypothetical protein
MDKMFKQKMNQEQKMCGQEIGRGCSANVSVCVQGVFQWCACLRLLHVSDSTQNSVDMSKLCHAHFVELRFREHPHVRLGVQFLVCKGLHELRQIQSSEPPTNPEFSHGHYNHVKSRTQQSTEQQGNE